MQSVAEALAFMHSRGVTHNDIKPENIMLCQAEGSGPRSKMTVKLGDLGLAVKSDELENDYVQYGLTTLCIATGEKFGSRKFSENKIEEYAGDVAALLGGGLKVTAIEKML